MPHPEPPSIVLTWREFVEHAVKVETAVLLGKLEVILQELKGVKEANRVEATEMQRRLMELNHAHERAVNDRIEMVDKVVNKDVFNESRNEVKQWRDQMMAGMEKLQGNSTFAGLQNAAVMSIIMAIATAALVVGVQRFFH